MKKYIIKYEDKSGDLTSVWVTASSKEEAKEKVKREYWDVVSILICQEA